MENETRSGSLQNSSSSRKEWRAVSDSHNFGNATDYVVMRRPSLSARMILLPRNQSQLVWLKSEGKFFVFFLFYLWVCFSLYFLIYCRMVERLLVVIWITTQSRWMMVKSWSRFVPFLDNKGSFSSRRLTSELGCWLWRSRGPLSLVLLSMRMLLLGCRFGSRIDSALWCFVDGRYKGMFFWIFL